MCEVNISNVMLLQYTSYLCDEEETATSLSSVTVQICHTIPVPAELSFCNNKQTARGHTNLFSVIQLYYSSRFPVYTDTSSFFCTSI